MNVCIVGWYGTETLGDRAILVGILKVLSSIDKCVNISLGSLFPFFSQRTLVEDGIIYSRIAPNVRIELFDSRNPKEIAKHVEASELILMGGGPILDITEIEIIAYAFKLGKKKRKRTLLFGCGIGPLLYKQSRKIVSSILRDTDLAIFRDKAGIEEAVLLNPLENTKEFYYSHDPALMSVMDYDKTIEAQRFNVVSVNFRKLSTSTVK